jgi:oligopeptide/dipeptide ABC transporter ATP-binding protein
MAAVPIPDPKKKMNVIILPGEVPSPVNPPTGCRFHPRCKYATDKCSREEPPFIMATPDHYVSCHYFGNFL